MMQRFLITRLSAIGDAILTMPLAVALRECVPDARIVWVAEPAAASLLQGHSCIDDVIVVPKRWLRSGAAWWHLRRALRAHRIDCAFDPQSLAKSALAARLSAAPRRIAFASPLGREGAPYLATDRVVPTKRHVVDRQLELLRPLGLSPGAPSFRLPRYESACERIDAWLDAARIESPFIVCNPSAAWPTKRWPADRYAEVARRLAPQLGVPCVVVWGGAAERELAEQIVDAAGDVGYLAPPTDLRELAELVRRAALLVASDTGPLHLAAAAGTPCVGLYGPTLPEVCGPYGTVHEAVQVYYQDGTSRQRRSGDNWAMRAITVDMVVQACHRVWRRRMDRPAA